MRKKIVAGNWKMNNNLIETELLLSKLKNSNLAPNVEVMVSPSNLFLKTSINFLYGSKIEVVSQNVHNKSNGAYTGEISVGMLKSIGINKSIIGHSERRSHFQESNETLLEKSKLCLENGLGIIFCFGEELSDRKMGKHFEVVENQLSTTVLQISKNKWQNIILAYEPVWAIGTGETASPDQAQEIHQFARNIIFKKFGKELSENTSILYGGSVKPKNASDIFSQTDVDGGLIGGASLIAEDFISIIESNSVS